MTMPIWLFVKVRYNKGRFHVDVTIYIIPDTTQLTNLNYKRVLRMNRSNGIINIMNV